MPCETCGHTMEGLGYANGGTIFHCPRCGTVSHADQFVDAPPRVYVPKLVERCRCFRRDLQTAEHIGYGPPGTIELLWTRLGIAESINTPENRS